MNTIEKLQKIFRDIFDDENLCITREMSAKDIEDWDSLAQINIVVVCEKSFNTTFTMAEITVLKNVGDMIDLIERKIK